MVEAIVLGSIELDQVTSLVVEENRKIAVHRWPGNDGDLVQDMGMAAAQISLTGVALGEKAGTNLERLRTAMQGAKPLDFTASAAVAANIDQVLITGLRVTQSPGFVNYYEYRMDLIRYVSPSAVSAEGFTPAGLASVDSAIHSEALTDVTGTVSALGKAAGKMRQIDDALDDASSKLSLIKGALKAAGELASIKPFITAGGALVKATIKATISTKITDGGISK